MATMTLRLGNRQGGRPAALHKEGKEIHILTVPEDLLKEARRVSALENSSVGERVEKLSSTSSVEEQLSSLRTLVNSHLEMRKTVGMTESSDLCLWLLSDLYFQSAPKSPVKCAIARMLLQFPEEAHENVAEYLSTSLNNLLISDTSPNLVMVAISCCFENFPLGVTAVSLKVMSVLDFISVSLKSYLVELSQDVSPAKKMEVCQMVHNALRVAVSLLQKCQAQVRHLICSEISHEEEAAVPDVVTALFTLQCRITDNSNTMCRQKENSPAVLTVNCVLQLVKSLMSFPDLPMDTHTNCGMVFVLLAVLLRKCNVKCIEKVVDLQLAWKVDMNTDNCQLTICMALLNVLTAAELSQHHSEAGEPLVNYIFHKLLAINQRNMADSGMVLGVSRAMLLLSRTAVDTCILEDILPELLQFVWTHLEHYMDSVRHNASGVLQNLVKQQACKAGSKILKYVVEAITSIPLHRKSKYIGLATLADVTGCQMLIDCIPNLVSNLLTSLSDPGITTHVSSAVEHLMMRHATECLESEWRTMWVTPILGMLSDAPTALCVPLQALLAAAVKHYPTLVSHILNNSNMQLRTILSCLCLARKQGALDTVKKLSHPTDLWKGILDLSILEQAMYHHDVEKFLATGLMTVLESQGRLNSLLPCDSTGSRVVRMSALSLLAESHRSTETFLLSELQLIKTFLVYNINTEIPSSRQQTIALMKKILTRLRDSSQAVYRKMGHNKVKKKQTAGDDVGSSILRSYNMFLLWLLDFSFSNLFPGANFGRRGSSLQMLTLCHEILSFDPNQPVWTPCAPDVWTPSNANVLLECLKDTYENNKLLALNLLIAFPAEALGLTESGYIQSLVEVCLSLASSHRPPDCITAAYLLRVLVVFEHTNSALEAISCKQDGVTVSYTLYLAIQVLVARLTAELDQASSSLLMAASSGPMYGCLFCIRQLLKQVDFKCIAEDAHWRIQIADVVNICFRLNEVVGPVVNSSSPEGHLPTDLQAGKDHLQQDCDGPASPVLNVTAQMVLLCSWRTVKEVSLFLGELAEQAPISCDDKTDEKCLLTEKQVLAIGAHLATLLAETKHRGAFEQAYVGFCALCSRLWRHPSARLHRLPQQWLHQIMEAITWGKGSKLCATRRSAGLPFMVQALVTTELQVGSNSSCFHKSMTTLLRLADSANNSRTVESSNIGNKLEKKFSEDSLCVENEEFSILGVSEISSEGVSIVEAQTHALNILRSLFRHSLLGELVTPYVAQGVIVAIRGFKGKTWAERNSATLLFSALVTRIFGVCRSKDTLSIRNRMTGRIFFQRYPALYDFLLEELKEAVVSMEECHGLLRPALFPVLLLLARLYPSSLEGTDSNLQLSVYAPYVHRCALSSVLKTRELAARALVPLVTPNQYAVLLAELLTIAADKSIIENYRHGLLLQIYHIVEEVASTTDINKEVLERIEEWITGLMWLLTSEQVCLISSQVYLHIVTVVLRHMFAAVSLNVWQQMYHILHSFLFQSQELLPSRLIGRGVFLHDAAQLLLLISLSTCDEHEDLVVDMLHHPEYQVVNIALFFIESLISEGTSQGDDSTLPADRDFYNWVSEWNRTHEGVLANKLSTSTAMGEILVKQVLVNRQFIYQECYQRTFLVLSQCPKLLLGSYTSSEDILRSLLRQCHEEYENVSWTILMCAGALANMAPSAELGTELCHALVTFSSTEKSLNCRITVANVLLNNTCWLRGDMQFLSVLDVCKLWTAVLTLLDDDSEYVRELISELVTRFDCTSLPVMSQKARELLLDHFAITMVHLDTLMCCVCLVVWCLGFTDSEDLTEDRVFDKGEMNIFAEAATLTDLVSGHLKKLLSQQNAHRLLETPLSTDVKLWVSEMWWPNSDSTAVVESCSSLEDFVKRAEQSVTIPCSASHFLLLSQKSGFLTLYRTKKLVEAIHEAVCDRENSFYCS